MVFDNYTQQYKVHIEGKWINPGKVVVPSPTLRCSSYWKGSLLVAFDYGRQLYLHLLSYWKSEKPAAIIGDVENQGK